MTWTDERVEALKKLWLRGLSASQVARQLGGVSRNAVIGKVHRLGLVGQLTPSMPRQVSRVHRPVRPVSVPRLAIPAPSTPATQAITKTRLSAEPVPIPPDGPGIATIFTLGDHMCKWPIGDPAHNSFTFCGRRTGHKGPYCLGHAGVAFRAPSTRKPAGLTELAHGLQDRI